MDKCKCNVTQGYKCLKHCKCTTKYTCLIHRPDYNYGYPGIEIDNIIEKENINIEEINKILKD